MRRKSWQRKVQTAILGGGPGREAVSEPRYIRRGQAGRASGVGQLP